VARRFQQVDVFTSVAYMGNPVAVVLDGEGLDDDQLPRFSSWTNLSETTFVLPPTTDDADYQVRIFSLERELPFAGHPTLGTCHAWLEAGGAPRDADQIVQECAAGLVRVRRTSQGLAFAAPPLVRAIFRLPSPGSRQKRTVPNVTKEVAAK
jgi:PhzF family phenazine biosynthesis protein